MTGFELVYKIQNKLRAQFRLKAYYEASYEQYVQKYSAYQHLKKKTIAVEGGMENLYMTARPNPGAGIGHQMANWIAGYWFAKQFGLKFAHVPFSNIQKPFQPNAWDEFLGFGRDEVSAKSLLKKGWKKVVLPLFDEYNEKQCSIIKNIIYSYKGHKVVFFLEQDQFYHDQYGVLDDINRKFRDLHNIKSESLIYDQNELNLAVHIRRGDIVQKPGQNIPNLTMRWISNSYFINAINTILGRLNTEKPVHIYLFSQGKEEDYAEFKQFKNVTYCLNMDAQKSFLHMVFADVLVTSKSSFSYKPALLNSGIKVCPKNFWHGYPNSEDWVLLNDEGEIE